MCPTSSGTMTFILNKPSETYPKLPAYPVVTQATTKTIWPQPSSPCSTTSSYRPSYRDSKTPTSKTLSVAYEPVLFMPATLSETCRAKSSRNLGIPFASNYSQVSISTTSLLTRRLCSMHLPKYLLSAPWFCTFQSKMLLFSCG